MAIKYVLLPNPPPFVPDFYAEWASFGGDYADRKVKADGGKVRGKRRVKRKVRRFI